MTRLLDALHHTRIRVRLVVAIGLMVAVAWAAMVLWASSVQRDTAIEQARDFAESVHQMTLAGLTGMMITNTVAQRAVFLDQIKHSNDIRMLRVLRGAPVSALYGPGTAEESAPDPQEREVLATGRLVFDLRRDGDREFLKAVMPAVAQRDYLGKNCLGCHQVPEGTVLGAVSMEIYLDKVNAAVSNFSLSAFLTAAGITLPLMALVWYFLSDWVARPLARMTRGLDDIAGGDANLGDRLVVHGSDEIALASRAFNRVIERAHRMVESERIAADVFDHALEGICVCDRRGRIVKVNRAFTQTTGYSAAEVMGHNPRILQSGRHDDAFYKEFWDAIAQNGQWQGEIWNRRRNGEIYPERLDISTVRDERGEVEFYIAVFSDITERKQQEALITYQAHHDALTGLPNRNLFRDRLEQALASARRHGDRPVAVMFLDLDRFKYINDSLGHDAGDALLREVTQRLRGCTRESDTVARLGGDEFTLLLPEISGPKDAEAVAAKILRAAAKAYRIAGRDLFVTASVGVALYPRDGRDGDTLMKNADAAMYHAKDQGRAGYAFYAEALGTRMGRHLQLDGALHGALDRGEIELLYHPQLDPGGGRVVALEVLARWRHPLLGVIPDEEFLTLAEANGMIVDIGAWMLRSACGDVAAWRATGVEVPVLCIALSVRQFHSEVLAVQVSGALQDTGMPPALLELEVSESLAMQDLPRTREIMNGLAGLGVRLAVSGFGDSFHAPANELRRLPVNAIKVERALGGEAGAGERPSTVVESMMRLAQDPRYTVVARDVDRPEQLAQLRRLRCSLVQGRLFCAPVPASEVPAVIARAAGVEYGQAS